MRSVRIGVAAAALVGIMALHASAALAQALSGQQPLTEAEQTAWPAIGQITYATSPGGAICTGTLVAADLVLTAGHCVAVNGEPMLPGDIQFAAGWRAGKSLAVRHGRAVIVARPSAGQPRTLPQDVALLVLDRPIDPAQIAPLQLSRQDLFAERYAMISYRRDAPDFIQRDETCNLAGTQPGILQLGCAVVSGNSGAPILMQRDGAWRVAGVMVAQANGGGEVRSYAVIPGDDLRARITWP
jgi:protease YdgD